MADDIMKFESTLPEDFTGVFYFTNWTDSEFVGKWGNKEYHFPAQATSPMIIPDQTPLEIQHIRKKFAKDLAEQEFFKGNQYERLRSQEGEKVGGMPQPRLNSIHQAATYTINDLTAGIQACLKPLEVKRAFVQKVDEIPMEEKLSKDEEGNLRTRPVKDKQSLRERALAGKGLPEE